MTTLSEVCTDDRRPSLRVRARGVARARQRVLEDMSISGEDGGPDREPAGPRTRGRGSAADRPTMHDVATLAGVSLKTVSRVVNREANVNEERRRRVEDAVARLGYRPNSAARSLRTGRGMGSIGLVIADLANPFYAAIAKAVEAVADRHRTMLVIGSSAEDPRRERQLATDLLRHPVDGLILVAAGDDQHYLEAERRLGAPIVFVDRPGGRIDADAVVLDNAGGTRAGVEHLIALGHRRIGFVGDTGSLYTARERLEGYRQALAGAGIAYDPSLVRAGSPRADLAEASARQLLDAGDVTAIFAENNRNSIGVLRAVRASGRQVAIVGFDDFELADMLPMPVTVVWYDPGELGRVAAELLFSRLAGDSRPPQRIVLQTRLARRGTGEVAPPN